MMKGVESCWGPPMRPIKQNSGLPPQRMRKWGIYAPVPIPFWLKVTLGHTNHWVPLAWPYLLSQLTPLATVLRQNDTGP